MCKIPNAVAFCFFLKFVIMAFIFLFWHGWDVKPELWRLVFFFPLVFIGLSGISGLVAEWAGANGQEYL